MPTKVELKEIAKNMHIRGYSKMTKEELERAIAQLPEHEASPSPPAEASPSPPPSTLPSDYSDMAEAPKRSGKNDRWIQHCRQFVTDHGVSYKEAQSSPECKEAYKKLKELKELK